MSLQFEQWSDGVTTVDAAIVTADDEGNSLRTRDGAVDLHAGDVVVKTDNPNMFDVMTETQWAETNYETAEERNDD